tara:strand:+ start:144 stop:1352 length:1209 start_codon:yes stop_codon:yes gene_type:complete
MKKVILLSLISFFFSSINWAQEKTFKNTYQIQSKAFGDERSISIYLPPDYGEFPEQKYTFCYVLDGQFEPFINQVSSIIGYGSMMFKYMPTIVVGIHAKNRGWEFSMPDEDYDGSQGGRAPELQAHLLNEVIPFVDSLYPNQINFRSLLGHSAGGEFVYHTLFGKNHSAFQAYIGISPAIYPDEVENLSMINEQLESSDPLPHFVYVSTGTVGENEKNFMQMGHYVDSVVKANPTTSMDWNYRNFEGLDHFTVVSASVNDAMLSMRRKYEIDAFLIAQFLQKGGSLRAEVEQFYAAVEKQLGFYLIPPDYIIKSLAFPISQNGYEEQALELYDWGISKYPNSYVLIKYKAKLLLQMGRKKEALVAFKSAKEKLEFHKEDFTDEVFQKEIVYLAKKMKACKLD